ncbi:MAG: glycosyltransferase family 2 protein [Xanthomonadales bacterium]|nr:glycosyltransferase family 2 protein [Xanthomonadales bacterium]
MAALEGPGLMAVTAVVVNFNTGETLARCIRALFAGSLKPDVLVIDNASSDRSARDLAQQFGNHAGLQLLFNPTNVGFAKAVNHAVGRISADWVLVLNPDCIVGSATVEKLIDALQADPKAALAAPAVTDPRGRIEKASLRRFPKPGNALLTLLGLWRLARWIPALEGVPVRAERAGTDPVVAEAVSGACMMVRRSAFVEVGMLDQAYGLHCEDLDLMYRLQQAGWHSLYVPGASAMHEQGLSSRSRPAWVHRQKHQGMQRFYDKFQAERHSAPLRWLVRGGIWAHYAVTLPLALLRR